MIQNIFPKFAGAKVSANISSYQWSEQDGKLQKTCYNIHASIPVRCSIAAIIQDIDYSLPISLNLIALINFFSRIVDK